MSLNSVKFNFHFSDWSYTSSTLPFAKHLIECWQLIPKIWVVKGWQNNGKQNILSSLFSYILKSVFGRSDLSCLIISHIVLCFLSLIKLYLHILMHASKGILNLPTSSLHSVHLFNKIIRSGFTINSPLFQNNWVKIHHRKNKVGWRFTKLICIF